MKKTNVNGYLKLGLIIVLSFMLLASILSFELGSKTAYADSGEDSIDEICRNYTNNKAPNGVSLDDYIGDFNTLADGYHYAVINRGQNVNLVQGALFSNNSRFSGANSIVNAQITGDDNIVKLVPRVLFTYENKTIFVGKAYGFVVITERMTDRVLKSTVIFLNVSGNVSDYLADINIEVGISLPFAYITQSTSITLEPVSTASASNIICNLALNGISSAVVPLARVESFTDALTTQQRLRYAESNDYMLGNISFAGQIRNQNDFNIGDPTYNANNDYGYFFIGNNYYYDCTRYGILGYKDGVKELPSAMLQSGIDFLKSKDLWTFEPPSLFTILMDVMSINDAMISIHCPIAYDSSNEGYGYSAQYLPNTRQSQINKYNSLIRAAHLILKPSESDDVAYFRKGDHARAQFSYSHTDGRDVFSQFEFSVGADIYETTGRTKVGAVASPSSYYDLGNPQAHTITSIGETDYYMLPLGSHKFSYSPQYTGTYIVESLEDGIDLYLNGSKITKSNGKYSLSLTANQQYAILLKNTAITSKIGKFKFDVKEMTGNTEAVTVKNNTVNIVKFVPKETGIYNFSANNATVQNVLTNQYSGTLERARTLNSSFVASQTISALCKQGKAYYIAIKGTSGAVTANITATKVNNTWNLGTNDSFVAGVNVEYHTFTVPSSSSANDEYIITFENAQNVSYFVFNENVEPGAFVYQSDGYLCLRNLTPGKKYYIGVYTQQSNTLIPTVAKNTADIFSWRISNNGSLISPSSSGTYLLQRGNTYQVNLYVNGKYCYRGLILTSDSLSNRTLNTVSFDTVNRTLTLSSDRDLDSHLTISAEGIGNIVLSVNTEYNESEIGIANVDLVNKIDFSFSKSSFVTAINYSVTGRNTNGAFSYNGTTTNGAISFLRDLYSRRAVGDTVVKVVSVSFKNKYQNSVATRSISGIQKTIKCSDTNVYNALQLYNIRNHNSDTITIKNDIDVSTLGDNWVPIPSFKGTLKGSLKTVSGIKIAIPASITGSRNFGFFGVVESTAKVTGFYVSVDITSDPKHGDTAVYVGGVAGINRGSLLNVGAKGSVVCNRNESFLGGLVGANYKDIGLSVFIGTVFGNGDMGGCVGYNTGKITSTYTSKSTVTHYVEGNARSVGGVVGYCPGGRVSDCDFRDSTLNVGNSGNVRNIKTRMGTIIGHLENATMKNDCAHTNSTWSSGTIKDTTYCFKQANSRIGRMDNGTIAS